MPHPEGYRKAERLMLQAERFDMPVVTLVDTPGANAGLIDEERGQSEAIASSIATMLALRVPTVSVVIGEGGSGGALAVAVGDRVLMLEHAIFTVASPEAAAAILWRDSARAPEAAQNMRITAQDLHGFGLVDGIIPEPVGGAHRNHAEAAAAVAGAISRSLDELEPMPVQARLDQRYHKYRDIGFYRE
jgi:acetyl-CoA carboxylase carboxyl transferase subunit alpha